jgi:hypothetical protein
MQSLPEILRALWGRKAPGVAQDYQSAFDGRELLKADLAMFCNVAGPIEGASEFERGVAEGKRRVWLHIARMCGLRAGDFVGISDGRNVNDE